MREFAERSGQVYVPIVVAIREVIQATIYGRLEEADKITRDMLARGEELGITIITGVFAVVSGIRALLLSGKNEEALQLVTTYYPIPNEQALCLVHLGREAEVVKILEQSVVARPDIGSAEDETPVHYDIMYLEAAVLTGHRPAAELLLNRLADCDFRICSLYSTSCIPRHLGGAVALLGKYDEARKYYQEAIKLCTEMPFRPELALSRLQLAELLLEHYPDEKKEALEHLDFAIKEFREMKMQPSLERALRHKDILKA